MACVCAIQPPAARLVEAGVLKGGSARALYTVWLVCCWVLLSVVPAQCTHSMRISFWQVGACVHLGRFRCFQ
jgi:hypothetical protein